MSAGGGERERERKREAWMSFEVAGKRGEESLLSCSLDTKFHNRDTRNWLIFAASVQAAMSQGLTQLQDLGPNQVWCRRPIWVLVPVFKELDIVAPSGLGTPHKDRRSLIL